ncbi:MAG: hypothetical protein BIFFINMI_01263 [Phycisphaerae bacterium]|nr:hypothetical protein [Phycisphaerae bacterium]
MTGSSDEDTRPLILLTGATGYVGGRLLRALEADGRRVRCMVRGAGRLAGRASPQTGVVEGEVLRPESLAAALAGVHTAYYLIHSLGSEQQLARNDRAAALNFASAACDAGVRRIVYLSGLGDPDQKLSPHLHSRQEVGRALRLSGVEVIEFRASILIGSGSLSFEMVRYMVERVPVMFAPRWVSIPAQPISITDLIRYLVAALDLPPGESRIFEIGGRDRIAYAGILREYARQRGLRRAIVPLPVNTPELSTLWLSLVTPLHLRAGRKLIDLVRHPALVRDDAALKVFDIRPQGIREAIAEALANEDERFAQTRWSDARSSTDSRRGWSGVKFGSRLVDSRSVHLDISPARAFAPIRCIGGTTGWYYGNWLWRLRGLADLLVGGVGMRRGRRSPWMLQVGETLDFWRVEAFEPDRMLRLSAEMKVPGRAWLQFEVEPGGGGATIRQTAIFDPVGLWGLLYWYLLYPIHAMMFRGMLRRIAARALAGEGASGAPESEPAGK